jgi:hypothetical protein
LGLYFIMKVSRKKPESRLVFIFGVVVLRGQKKARRIGWRWQGNGKAGMNA